MAPPVPHAERERELVQATRALFDLRGMQEAPVEEIAKAVGIARGLIYRQFSSKEELYVLTVTDYLAELSEAMEAAGPDLEVMTEAFARFCVRYPAFLDCALQIMRRPADELRAGISESVWLRLGAGMESCIGPLCDVLRARGVADADFRANVLWTQGLGLMHLARIRVGLQRGPGLFTIDEEEVIRTCVESSLRLAH